MARRKRDVTDQMLRAGQAGESAKQRTHEGRIQSKQESVRQDQAQQRIDLEGDRVDQGQQRINQQTWENNRQARERADAVRAKNQAKKPRATNFGSEGSNPHTSTQDVEQNIKAENVNEEKRRQFDERQELDAAKAGLEKPRTESIPGENREGPANSRVADTSRAGLAAGDQGPPNPEAVLKMEEEQRRQNQQVDRQLESRGRQKGYVSSELGKENEARERTKTASIVYNAITARKRLGLAMQRAQAAYDNSGSKEDKETLAKERWMAQSDLRNLTNIQDKVDAYVTEGKRNRKLTDEQTNILKELAAKVQGAPGTEAIMGPIASGIYKPRTVSFIAEKKWAMAVDFMAEGSGALPDVEYIDTLAAGYKQWVRQIELIEKSMNLDHGGPAGLMSNRSRATKQRLIQKLAALNIKRGNLILDEEAQGGQNMPAQAVGRRPQQQPQRQAPVNGPRHQEPKPDPYINPIGGGEWGSK